MLIRMVHVRPSLGPIPPASPTPHAHSRALRWPPRFGSHLPFHLMARPRRPACRPGAYGDSTTCAKRVVAANAPAMSRTTTKPDVLRHRGRGPSFRDRLQRWKLRPRLDAGIATTAPGEAARVTLLATVTAIYQGILVPMRGASVLRPSTQALDGMPCPPASRLGPPLAARFRLTLHSGPLPGDWPVRLLRDSFGWGGHAGRRIRVLPHPPSARP
jgi:hypothetical protein